MEPTLILDPAMQNIILGVIANSLSGFASYSFIKIKNSISKNNNTKSILKENIDAIEHFAEINNVNRRDIYQFVGSPEVESILRQIYSSKLLIDDNYQEKIDLIKPTFICRDINQVSFF